MERDYTYQCLRAMDKQELTEFSLRILHRLISEETLRELYRFDDEEFEGEEKAHMAHIDAMVKMHAIALGQLPAMFEGSDQAMQNTQRMTRLLMWHFYAIAFHLEQSVDFRNPLCGSRKTDRDTTRKRSGMVNPVDRTLVSLRGIVSLSIKSGRSFTATG